MNKLTYNGKDYDSQITAAGGGLEMNHSMVGETLSVDVLTVPVVSGNNPIKIIAADQEDDDFFLTVDREVFSIAEDTLEFIDNGAGLYSFDDMLIGKYFLNELTQAGEYDYTMRFYSAIKLLNETYHFGGLYTGELAGDIIADIMGELDYTIDDDVAEIQTYGYLPYATRRSNLQMLLMAIGGAIRNAADGTLRVTSLTDTVTGVLDESRVFVGGSIVDKNPATAVQVTEHNFLATEEVVTLYDGVTINAETITFREPYHDLQITGGTITESGVNYCKFTGSGAVVITGKRYTHVTRVLTHGTPPTGSDRDIVRSVTNNTLITPVNGAEVTEKLYDYLSVAKSIKAEVVFGTERPGDVVSIIHPYTKQMVSACIKSMSIQMGFTELRAQSEFLIDYIPPGATAGFEHYALLTGTGEWTVPEGVTKIRVIAVEPGSSGNPGGNGQNGTTSSAGSGGAAGAGGSGGKILEINLSVTPLETIEYSCGEHTIFNDISAAMGRSYPYGYSEPKTGLILGKKGADGYPGGRGMPGGEPVTNPRTGVTYYPGANGSPVTEHGVTAYPGGGGGAATGGNGQNGKTGYVARSGTYPPFTYTPIHGGGGNGAPGANGSDATGYGEGGQGGDGGGGGGMSYNNSPFSGEGPGIGGSGGAGGLGGPGCIIVYY